MNNEIVKHETNFPPSSSKLGSNAYYLRGCEVVQRSPSYASCLYKIGEIEAGRVDQLHAECAAAVTSGRCTARQMRQEEDLAGVALYFFPRIPPAPLHLPVSVSGDFGVRITNLTDPALIPRMPNSTPSSRFLAAAEKVGSKIVEAVMPKKPKSGLLDAIDAGSYADAINASPAPAPAKKPITKDDLEKLAKPGESLIETAKRLLNKVKEPA